MTTANLFIAGRIIWTGDLGETKTGSPMRGVLAAVDDAERGEEPKCAPVFVRLFGTEAEHAGKGDWLAAEGPLETSLREREGKPVVSLSIMAKWARLTGHRDARKQRSEAQTKKASGHQQPVPDTATCGASPPFDDALPF